MEWKPRLIDPQEVRAAGDLLATAFADGRRMPDDQYTEQQHVVEADRTFVVEDDTGLVSCGGAYTFDLSVPGGALPMAGVTWMAVLSTHRRRGILTAVMNAVLDQAIERGEPMAGLTASEAGIYRRFGFGVATRAHKVLLDTTRTAEVSSPAAAGRVRLVSEKEAETILPPVWERHWRRTPGELTRTNGWWAALAVDPEGGRQGATSRFLVVHETPAGEPDGYAAYRFMGGAVGDGYNELRIDEVVGADYAVEATLVRYLSEVDLTRQMRWDASLDLPLLWQLADPRALQVVKQADHLWLRLLDVPACLAGRHYAADGGVVMDVIDSARPHLGGRFMLDTSPEGAECTATTAEADVRVQAADLGALYLGTVSWRTLQLAGLVDEQAPGAVERLDHLFRPVRAPYCLTHF